MFHLIDARSLHQRRPLRGRLPREQPPNLQLRLLLLSRIGVRRPCDQTSAIRLRFEAYCTYHFIGNLVTLGFALISLTSFSNWIFSGGADFISSLSYSVF